MVGKVGLPPLVTHHTALKTQPQGELNLPIRTQAYRALSRLPQQAEGAPGGALRKRLARLKSARW